jgi:hypothetical protein
VTSPDSCGQVGIGVDAKRNSGVLTPHNHLDISGQEQTEFPVPGGQNGWPSLLVNRLGFRPCEDFLETRIGPERVPLPPQTQVRERDAIRVR